MNKIQNFLLPILIGLVTLPRLSVDLYLPSLTNIGTYFNASDESLQMTLTAFMFGYALSMIIAGPLSDVLGKKRVLIYGLILFLLATIVLALTESILVLIIARFFQALGGCCGTLIARVLVKESYSKQEQIKVLTHLSSAMAICPLLIPILGGTLQLYFDWRVTFELLGIISLILLITCMIKLKETPIYHQSISIKQLFIHYKQLLTHNSFIAYSIAIGCAWSNYFAFTIESPFLLQKVLGYDSFIYGILIAISVVGYLIGISITRRYANVIGWDKLIHLATIISVCGASVLMLSVLLFPLHWLTIIGPMVIIMIGVGIIIPCTQAAVMQPFPNIAGTVSGLFFFIQMMFGTVCGFILQSLPHNTALPMASVILLSSIILISLFSLLINNYEKSQVTN